MTRRCWPIIREFNLPDMPVNIQIEGLSRLQDALARYPGVSSQVFSKAINASLALIDGQATDDAFQFKIPRDRRTGGLKNSFAFGKKLATPSRLSGSIGPTVKYALFVEQGTKPHVITPKNKKALYWPGADHPVRSVNHPGSAPNPFMERLASRAKPHIDKIMAEGLAQVLKTIKT